MGVKWPWCVLLCFLLMPPLFNLSVFPTFTNRKCDTRACETNLRDIWAGWMCGSFATMKASLQGGDVSLNRGRGETGNREHVRGVNGIQRMRVKLDSHLEMSPPSQPMCLVRAVSCGSFICPFLTAETSSAPGHAFHLHLISSKAYCQESASHK